MTLPRWLQRSSYRVCALHLSRLLWLGKCCPDVGQSGEVNALGHRLPGRGKPVVQEAAGGLARHYDIQVSGDGIHAPILMQYATITSYPSVAGSEPVFVVTAASNGWNLDGFKAARIVPGL